MKSVSGYVVSALVLAVLGGVCLAAGMIDRELARGDQRFVALQFDEPDAASARLERYVEYGSRLPWIGGRALDRIRARKAAVQYWRHRYDLIVPSQTDPIAGLPSENVELQLVVANAVYRQNQAHAINRTSTLQALDAAINAYLAVLKNAGGNSMAAYNYEYVVRVREDVDKGRHAPELTDTAEDGPAGKKGGPPPQDLKRNFKILIPLEPGEMDKGLDPGKGTPIERKG